MVTRKVGQVFITALVCIMAFGLVAGSAAAEPPQMVKVLIGFDQLPGPAEEALVHRAGGTVKYTYHLIPCIAASVPEAAINGLQRNPRVKHVHLDGRVWAIDTELDNSWGVNRIGAGNVHPSNKGTGVKVAIIDSGTDYTHPDLGANFDHNGDGSVTLDDILGYDFVNKDADPMDDYGHGTHVAGIVAAEDNDIGVVGVAPEAALYALKVLDEKGGGYWSDVIAAIQWSVDNDMQVINMSLGGTGTLALELACDAAYNAGLVLVAAAGNGGNPPGKGDNVIEPASYTSVIAVAATNQDDTRARWSSTGPDLELAAPGVGINSTLLGGGYGENSGTSMASPHVAGTTALLWVAHPLWTNDDVRTQLQNTADDLGATGFDTKYGYGLVDADEAAPPAPVATGSIAGVVTDASTGAGISGATVTDGTRSATTDASGYYSISDVPEGTYTVTASAEGYESQSVEGVVVTKDTTTTVNFALSEAAPVTGTMSVDSITFSSKVAGPNKFLYTTVKVVDGSGSPLEGVRVEMTLTHESNSWNFAGDTKNSTGEVKFTLLKAPSGYYTATVTNLVLTDYIWDTTKGVTSATCELKDDGTVIQ